MIGPITLILGYVKTIGMRGGRVSCKLFYVWDDIYYEASGNAAFTHHLQHFQGTIHT